MKGYFLRAASNSYRGLIMTAGNLFDMSRRFNGAPVKTLGKDVKIGWDPDMLSMPKGDFPSLIPNVPIFSRRAVAALRDLLEPNGEILPVMIAGAEYFLYNVTRVVDALDESGSDIVRFKDSSDVLTIHDFAFFEKKVSGMIVFKIPQEIDGSVFVTDPFVRRVQAAGLKGFWFPLLWSSE